MNEFIEKTIDKAEEKIKVTSLEIIVTGTKDKPYFEIKYKEVGNEEYNIGYGSYDLNNVFGWKEECFEIVNELAEEYNLIMNYNTLLNDIKSQLKQFIADSNNIDYNRALVEAIEVIDKKAEEYNGGWIPTSKRLPKKDGYYLITDNGRVHEVYYQDGFWLDPIELYEVYHNVTAWRSLPKPYNPKGE